MDEKDVQQSTLTTTFTSITIVNGSTMHVNTAVMLVNYKQTVQTYCMFLLSKCKMSFSYPCNDREAPDKLLLLPFYDVLQDC